MRPGPERSAKPPSGGESWRVGGGRRCPGRGGNRDTWGILAGSWVSLSLEQFPGKAKSFWRRDSEVTSSILSKMATTRREHMCVGGMREK